MRRRNRPRDSGDARDQDYRLHDYRRGDLPIVLTDPRISTTTASVARSYTTHWMSVLGPAQPFPFDNADKAVVCSRFSSRSRRRAREKTERRRRRHPLRATQRFSRRRRIRWRRAGAVSGDLPPDERAARPSDAAAPSRSMGPVPTGCMQYALQAIALEQGCVAVRRYGIARAPRRRRPGPCHAVPRRDELQTLYRHFATGGIASTHASLTKRANVSDRPS